MRKIILYAVLSTSMCNAQLQEQSQVSDNSKQQLITTNSVQTCSNEQVVKSDKNDTQDKPAIVEWKPFSNIKPPNVPEGEAWKPGRPKIHKVDYVTITSRGVYTSKKTINEKGDEE